jgi:uncharacterized membrane protein
MIASFLYLIIILILVVGVSAHVIDPMLAITITIVGLIIWLIANVNAYKTDAINE